MIRGMNKILLVLTALLVATGCDFVDHEKWQTSHVEAPDFSKYPRGLIFPATLQISPEFTVEEQQAIVAAVDLWKARTNGMADVTPVVGDDQMQKCNIRPVAEPLEGAPSAMAVSEGAPQLNACNILVVRKQIDFAKSLWDDAPSHDVMVEQVVTHELGHVFGLEHLEDQKSIMFWSYETQNVGLDDEAVVSFCNLRGCPNGMRDAK